MVFTRNQKRKFDLVNDDEIQDKSLGDHLQVNNNFTNVKIIKKKKPASESNTCSDTDTEISYSSNDTAVLKDSLDFKQNIQNIIKDSIQKFVKQFKSSSTEKEKEKEKEKEEEEESESSTDDEYDRFIDYTSAINDGVFFERSSIDNRKKHLKSLYNESDVADLNKQLKNIHNQYKDSAPSVIDILKMNIDVSQKQKYLEKIYHYNNSELLSAEYLNNLKFFTTNLKSYDDPDLHNLEKEILKASNNLEYSDNYREKILKSKMSFENKVIAYKRLEVMEAFEANDTSEYAKYKSWMDILLSIPFDSPIVNDLDVNDTNQVKSYIKNVRSTLDQRLSFLEKPKDQVLNVVTQMIKNPKYSVNAIGLYGNKGLGKTALVKSISEALNRPYRTINLGGESDASLLTGHGFTYVGSCPGRIIEILRETKCTNPIILFDELDKVSETHHGKEIIGNLIHLTDSTSNNKYNYDKYFSGLEFDLSNVLFIFTYNDASKVDKILADRLFKIRVENYTFKEKLEIATNHLIKTVLDQYKFTDNDISFDEDTIYYIVESSKSDQGMRDIKRKFEIIVSRINTLLLTDESENIIRLKYKSLYNYYKALPVKVLKSHVDILLSESISNDSDDKFASPPFGMYI
jgi:ATP-dependent Lon protease